MTDIFAKVMALPEEGRLSATTAVELYSVPKITARTWLQRYRGFGQVGRPRGTSYEAYPAQFRMLH